MRKIVFVLVSILVLIGLIALSGAFNAPGWFIDIEVLGEGILLINALRARSFGM